ncbi:hypothetical protein Rhe02_14610 [Rhizocola hellebori]|uniref:Uncharacterized protein n=2 Tax=Rhizocola hellebori TaxID=1392758 RepID=A0A8J3Q4Q1_9ACTN|nr:hypothetical protein Rhe02_14610 [Rhizocola hellebori]
MASRGFLGFAVDGTEKISYVHDDSYPQGTGAWVLRWLRSRARAKASQLPDQVRALRVVRDDDKPTPQDVQQLHRWSDMTVGSASTTDWYCLLRRTQGHPVGILAAGVILDSTVTAFDSVWTDWGYIVDLDTACFEVYRGGEPAGNHPAGRFAGRVCGLPALADVEPCSLLASWPLTALPFRRDFLAKLGAV